MSERYAHYIGGQWVAGDGEWFDNINPADSTDIIGQFPQATESDVRRAANAAQEAFPLWRSLPAPSRGEFLAKAADVLERRLDEVATALVREEGKTKAEAMGETNRGVVILRYYATEGLHQVGEVIPSTAPNTLLYTTRTPLGVVTLITPWNFPVAIPYWKAAPALVYGNTVLLKPSGLSPLTGHLMADVFHEAGLPPGVFNLIQGRARSISDTLIDNGSTRAVSFTGSAATGKKIAVTAVGIGAKYQLEMGGQNPVIVMDDADLNQAVELTVSGAMRSAGEKCTATSRAIVLDEIADDFTENLVARVKSLKVGPGTDPDCYLGPVISEDARQSILSYIRQTQDEGATLACGGGIPSGETYEKGFYVEPTVFTDVTPAMTLACDEVFGPVLAVIKVRDFDEALEIANGVTYGLSASIFTRDLNSVLAYTDGIEAGLIRVNGETAGVEPQAPFGGMKGSSSYSREQGRAAMDFYTQIKTVYLQPSD
ncbi:MAG: aldehyde dehydrogenase family protein [Candidatus Latescibacteria bacterium]|jgi:aldehyde dehydrogenase (NAD+)|nr:aldehyde dehydrogenase family protein [Candidatus Latescibacterota bacterium]